MLAQRAWLVEQLAATGIRANCVVIADDENLDIAREFGFPTIEQDNTQLGRKVNDGIQFACREGADYIAFLGSDDWVHPDLFAPTLPDAIVSGRKIALVDLATNRLRCLFSRGRHGVIPWLIPRRALPPGYRPLAETQNRGLDLSLALSVARAKWVFHDPHELCRVDFKSDTNITAYDQIARTLGVGQEVSPPWDLLAEFYPRDLVALAEQTAGRS